MAQDTSDNITQRMANRDRVAEQMRALMEQHGMIGELEKRFADPATLKARMADVGLQHPGLLRNAQNRAGMGELAEAQARNAVTSLYSALMSDEPYRGP